MVNATATGQKPQRPLKEGDPIPPFSLKDQDGHVFNIADYIGKHGALGQENRIHKGRCLDIAPEHNAA